MCRSDGGASLQIITTPDMINYTTHTTPSSAIPSKSIAGDEMGRFLSPANNAGTQFYSSDGAAATWSNQTYTTQISPYMAYVSPYFIGCSNTARWALHSSANNPTVWNEQDMILGPGSPRSACGGVGADGQNKYFLCFDGAPRIYLGHAV